MSMGFVCCKVGEGGWLVSVYKEYLRVCVLGEEVNTIPVRGDWYRFAKRQRRGPEGRKGAQTVVLATLRKSQSQSQSHFKSQSHYRNRQTDRNPEYKASDSLQSTQNQPVQGLPTPMRDRLRERTRKARATRKAKAKERQTGR